MGVFYDLGRPIVGGWMRGGWLSHDRVRSRDLLWAGEFGQEGAILFAVDVDTAQVAERYRIGAREFSVVVDHSTGRVWVPTYHGLNQPGNLLWSWRPETGTLQSHGFPPLSGERFVGAVSGRSGEIYIGTHPGGRLVCFDPDTDTWTDYGCMAPQPIVEGQQIWCRPQWINEVGEIICRIVRTRPGDLIAFDPATGQMRRVGAEEETASDRSSSPVDGHPEGSRREVEQVDLDARTYVLDGQLCSFVYDADVATDIVGLNKGPHGKIYGSTIISMHMFVYDPVQRQLDDLGRVGFGNGEIYDVIALENKLYLGSYTGAYWAVYDPEKEWDPQPETEGRGEGANPRLIGQLGQQMNRPFEYVVGPGPRGLPAIYIACRADYGYPGGGLACFRPEDESIEVFRDSEQSVQSVAADTRYVYGGTSIEGGRGCVNPTRQVKLFMFDPAQKQRVYECIPIGEAIAVTSLAVSPVSGLVYGVTDTAHLFAFDPDQRQVVELWTLRSKGTPLMGVPETYGIIHLTAASDGDIYGVTNQDVFKLDLSTGRIIYLDPPPIPDLYQIVEGEPGVFYIGARGHLLEYHVRNTPHFR